MKLNKVGRASSPPRGFNQAAYQTRIDDTVGTRDGASIMRLAWAPAERRWMPCRLTTDGKPINPQGYVFPIFCNGKDANGELTAPNRWVLLERIEPEQFVPTWEKGRYSQYDGSWWDWKGPLPTEKYIELRAHCYHDGLCCKCIGLTCTCGEDYNHCWGKYAEPNESLMDWIRQTAWAARNDSDVDPTGDIRYFEAPQAQRDLVNAQQTAKEKEDAEMEVFDAEMRDLLIKNPHSIQVTRTEGGLFVPTSG